MRRRAFVVGGEITKFIGARHPDFIWKKHPDFGKIANPDLEHYITSAVNGALAATGVAAAQVDKAWIGNFCGELFSSQGHLGAAVVGAHPDLVNKPVMRVEGACASGGLAFTCAVDSINAGTDVALVVGAEVQTTVNARVGGDYLARASHYARQRPIDELTFPALFAQRIKACYEAGVAESGDLAALAVKACKRPPLLPDATPALADLPPSSADANANKNPKAHMVDVKMDLPTASGDNPKANPCFLSNEELSPYLRLSDCSQVRERPSSTHLSPRFLN